MSDIHALQQNMDSTPEMTLAQARDIRWLFGNREPDNFIRPEKTFEE